MPEGILELALVQEQVQLQVLANPLRGPQLVLDGA